MERKYQLTSSRDSRGRFCIHLRIGQRQWQRSFELKTDAMKFAEENTERFNALIAVVTEYGLSLDIQEAFCNIFDMPFVDIRSKQRLRRFFLIFSSRVPYRDAQRLFKLTPRQCEWMDSRNVGLDHVAPKHFVVCFERELTFNTNPIPLGWELNARAMYEYEWATDTYLPIHQPDINYTDALRKIAEDIVPYTGRIGMQWPPKRLEES